LTSTKFCSEYLSICSKFILECFAHISRHSFLKYQQVFVDLEGHHSHCHITCSNQLIFPEASKRGICLNNYLLSMSALLSCYQSYAYRNHCSCLLSSSHCIRKLLNVTTYFANELAKSLQELP